MVVHSSPARTAAMDMLTKREREALAHGRLKPRANKAQAEYQETQLSSSLAHMAYIDKIQLGLMDPDHLRRLAVVRVNKATLKCKGFPAKNSVNATQMGPPDRNHTCTTCHQAICKCDGAAQFGLLELPAPVYHSWQISIIQKVINLVCWNCSHLLLDKSKDKFRKIVSRYGKDPKTMMTKMLAASKRITRCDCARHEPFLQPQFATAKEREREALAVVDTCRAAHEAAVLLAASQPSDAATAACQVPLRELEAAQAQLRLAVSARARFSTLQYDFQFDGVVLMRRLKPLRKKDGREISDEERKQWEEEKDWREVSPKRVRAVFAGMNSADIRVVGMDPDYARPEWMVLTVLPIPEMRMRPKVTSGGGKAQSEDALTRQLQGITKVNEELNAKIAEIREEMARQLRLQQQQQQQQQQPGRPGVRFAAQQTTPVLRPINAATAADLTAIPLLGKNGKAPKKKIMSTITAMLSADKERKKAARAKQESKLSFVYDENDQISIAPSLHVDEIDTSLRTGVESVNFDPWTHSDATKELMEDLQYKIALYFKDNIKAKIPKRHRQRAQKSRASHQQRLIKKRGHVRGGMLAKRVDFSARAVLSPDPNLRANEIGMPRQLCKELTIGEVVDESNYVELLRAVYNGPDVYPGANAVILENGDVIDLRYINRYKFKLRFGMTVERHLINGDEVVFNRQPSLHKMSMMGHRVVVHDFMTIRLNLAAMSPYNADCMSFDTAINLHQGISISLREFVEHQETQAHSVDVGENLVSSASVSSWLDKEQKECIELLFNDGSTVTCTPDHRFRKYAPTGGDEADDEWIQAKDIQEGTDEIASTLSFPFVELDKEISECPGWELDLESTLGYRLNFQSRANAMRALAFCRLIGYCLTDGSISDTTSPSGSLFMGSEYDASIALDDIELLTGIRPNARQDKTVQRVPFPAALTRAIVAAGVAPGNRIHQLTDVPPFLRAPDAPICLVREFIGGLFGGDGVTISLSKQKNLRHARGYSLIFTSLRFCMSKKGSLISQQLDILKNDVGAMLSRLGINTDNISYSAPSPNLTGITKKQAVEIQEKKDNGEVLRPGVKDLSELVQDQSYSLVLYIKMDEFSTFADKIGFRYCSHKQMRLAAAACYYRQRDLIVKQRALIIRRVEELNPEKRGGVALKVALEQAKSEFSQNHTMHPEVRDWTIFRWQWRKMKAGTNAQTITIDSAMETFDIRRFFSEFLDASTFYSAYNTTRKRKQPEDDETEEAPDVQPEKHKIVYGTGQDETGFKLFRTKVIAKRPVGLCQVYDLSMENIRNNNFVATGRIVHNCDGDTIIIHVPQKATTRNEVRTVMDVDQQTLTPQSNKPVMGLIQDTVWSLRQMTLRDVLMREDDFFRYASKSQAADWRQRLGRPAALVRKSAILVRPRSNDSDDESDDEYDVNAAPTPARAEYEVLRSGKQLFSTTLPRAFHLCGSDYHFQLDTTLPHQAKASPALDLSERLARAEQWLADTEVAIIDSKLIRGSLNGTITGKSSGGIAHYLALEHTSEEVQAFFASAQQVASPWTADEGLSVGPSDLHLGKANKETIRVKMREMLYAIQNFEHLRDVTNRQIAGAQSPAQRSVAEAQLETLEQKLCVALNDVTTHLGEDAMDMAGPTNRMVQMISLAKSKGDKFNFTQMVVALGQQIVFGARIARDDRITSHHPNRPDHWQARPGVSSFVPGITPIAEGNEDVEVPTVMEIDPDICDNKQQTTTPAIPPDYEADCLSENGFINHSFVDGLKPYQFYSHSMGGREGLLNTSEETKKTGYCQRRLSKAMENNIVAEDLSVRNGNGQIVERLYGRDGFDATFLQRATLHILKLSNQALSDRYMPTEDEMVQLLAREQALGPSDYALTSHAHLASACAAEVTALNSLKVHLLKQKLHFSGDTLVCDVLVPANMDRTWFKCAYAALARQHYAAYVDQSVKYSSTLLTASVLLRTMRSFIERLYSYYPVASNRLWAFELLLLSTFSTRRTVIEHRFSLESLQEALELIERSFTRTLIQPGEMVGSLASQMLSATFTQNALDFFKHAGVGKNDDGGAEGNVEEIIDLNNDPESGALRIYLLPYSQMRDVLPVALSSSIDAQAQSDYEHDLLVSSQTEQLVINAEAAVQAVESDIESLVYSTEAKQAFARAIARSTLDKAKSACSRAKKACWPIESYQQRRLCRLFAREITDYNLEHLIDENALVPEDDSAWLSVAERLMAPSDRAQLAKRQGCVLRFVLNVERCRQLGVTRRQVQQCIHEYLQENVVYDWPADESASSGRAIRSDVVHASALPTSEALLLQYTEVLVKQRDQLGAEATAAAVAPGVDTTTYTPTMQEEKNTYAVILLSPQLQPEVPSLAPGVAATLATSGGRGGGNWVVRVYIHPESKYAKQFGKNATQTEDDTGASTSEMSKLLSADIRFNARVHGIKGVLHTNVVTETQEVLDEEHGCIRKRIDFAITTKGSNILDVLSHPLVDTYRTSTNHLREALNVWGIKTGGTLLLRILKKKLKALDTYVDHRHILNLVETMTHRGQYMKMRRNDMNRMKTSGPIQRISFEQPVEVATEASCSATVEHLIGVSENVMLGNLGPMGPATCDVRLDDQMPDEATKRLHIQHMQEKVLMELNDLDRGVFLYASGHEQIFRPDDRNRPNKHLRLGSIEGGGGGDSSGGTVSSQASTWELSNNTEYAGDLFAELSGVIDQQRSVYHATQDKSSLKRPLDAIRLLQLRARQQYAMQKCAQDHDLHMYQLSTKPAKLIKEGNAVVVVKKPTTKPTKTTTTAVQRKRKVEGASGTSVAKKRKATTTEAPLVTDVAVAVVAPPVDGIDVDVDAAAVVVVPASPVKATVAMPRKRKAPPLTGADVVERHIKRVAVKKARPTEGTVINVVGGGGEFVPTVCDIPATNTPASSMNDLFDFTCKVPMRFTVPQQKHAATRVFAMPRTLGSSIVTSSETHDQDMSHACAHLVMLIRRRQAMTTSVKVSRRAFAGPQTF